MSDNEEIEWDLHEDLIDALMRICKKFLDNNLYEHPYCLSYQSMLSYELMRNSEKKKEKWL